MTDPSQSGLESHQTGAVRPEEAARPEVTGSGFHGLVADVAGDEERTRSCQASLRDEAGSQTMGAALPRVDAGARYGCRLGCQRGPPLLISHCLGFGSAKI